MGYITFDDFLVKTNVKKKEPNDCWEWTRSKMGKGYGQVSLVCGRKMGLNLYKYVGAHRLAFELYHNCKLAFNLQVRHTCDNPGCVNVNHLTLGRNQDNINDKVSRKRQKHIISREKRQEIVDLYKTGNYYQETLARKFGVDQTTISKIIL